MLIFYILIYNIAITIYMPIPSLLWVQGYRGTRVHVSFFILSSWLFDLDFSSRLTNRLDGE